MSDVRAWILSICFASFSAGIMQFFTPQKNNNSVIKLVLTLYILVAAFAPIQAFKYPDTRIALPESTNYQAAINADEFVYIQTKQNIENDLNSLCLKSGIDANVQVEFSENYQIIKVTISDASAKDIIKQQLGDDIPIYIKEE